MYVRNYVYTYTYVRIYVYVCTVYYFPRIKVVTEALQFMS